jgi:hypothetical protein
VDGYEADDVIASIAERARAQDPPVEVMVVTATATPSSSSTPSRACA